MTDLMLPEEFSEIVQDTQGSAKPKEPKIMEYKLYYDPVYANINKVNWVNEPRLEWNIWLRWVDTDWGWLPNSWSMDIVFSATDSDTVEWTSGTIYYADWTTLAVNSWNTWNMTAVTYIYSDWTDTLKTTTTASSSVWEWQVLICVASNTSWGDAQFQAFGTLGNWVFITADNIAANTITANEIASNTITATQMNVSQLSAIAADLWTITAGTVTWATIQTTTDWSWSILARDWSWSTYKEVKMYVSSSIPQIKFTYNNTDVWSIRWWSYTIDGSTTNTLALVTPATSDYVYTNGSLYVAGKMRIPVGTNLYN